MKNWPTIAPDEVLQKLIAKVPAIDVRSPGEFDEGSVPGFENAPILTNDQRHLVGLTYKQEGQEKAIQVGLELVQPLKEKMVLAWLQKQTSEKELLVTCWRGGLRSRIACEWITAGGGNPVQVIGGYKALRRRLIETFSVPREWVSVAGLTGTGKSILIRKLPQTHVLDLEKAAHHRGSAFGSYVGHTQPRQQIFENTLGLSLLNNTEGVVTENEGHLIGVCAVPDPLREQLSRARVVRVKTLMEDRVQNIFHEYITEPLKSLSPNELQLSLTSSLQKIQRSLGGLRFSELSTKINSAFQQDPSQIESHQDWIETLLTQYYDPMYEFSKNRDLRKTVFEGNPAETQEFLQACIDRWRS